MTEIKAKKVIFKNRDGEYLLPWTEEKIGLSMFDTILKDHVLTYEESKGLALQGTWVYKEAIAGERFGYPDFYAKCLEEYNDLTNSHDIINHNYEVVGSPTITDDGVASGFNSGNYISIPNAISLSTNCKIQIPFTTTSDITTEQQIFVNTSGRYLIVKLANGKIITAIGDGTSWLANITSPSLIQQNMAFLYELIFDGEKYSVSLNGVDNGEYKTTHVIPPYNAIIGSNTSSQYWQGSIDLKQFSITVDGKEVYRAVDTIRTNQNGHKFYPMKLQDYVNSIFNTTGMAWMYGIDQENERIFLPRNVWFEQMSMDDVGKAVEAGLPNIEGYINGVLNSGNGAFAYNNAPGSKTPNAAWANPVSYGYDFDASRSSPIYGNSDTVQPNAVKKLLYICVGTSNSDTSWLNVVEQVRNGAKDIEDKRVQALSDIAVARDNIATDKASAIADIEKDRKQALTDLTNKENAGLSALANASNALRTTQITNCITEIPRTINFELSGTTVTLKAGSAAIVPDGFEEDGVTPKFQYDITTTDQTYDFWGDYTEDFIFLLEGYGSRSLSVVFPGSLYSGPTAPTVSDSFAIWYDTTNNIMQRTYNGGTNWSVASHTFPVAVVSVVAGVPTAVKYVFNGMGYIGSTLWVDKGIKGLIPNGRNEDGTLRNIEWINNTLITKTFSGNYNSAELVFDLIGTDYGTHIRMFGKDMYLDEKTNTWVNTGTGITNTGLYLVIGVYSMTSGVITSWTPKLPFRAVNYSQVDGQWVQKYAQLSTAKAVGAYTLDLSPYLPNDGYTYEVQFYIGMASANETVYTLGTKAKPWTNQTTCLWGTVKTTSNARFATGNFTLPINNRVVYSEISTSAVSSFGEVYMVGYRRLGTNA